MAQAKKWLKPLLELSVALLLFVAGSIYLSRNMLPTETSVPELQLPQLQITLENGVATVSEPKTISWQAADKTLVYLFAPWCGVCRVSMKSLSLLPEETNQIVVVALDWSSVEEVAKFVGDVGYEGTVLLGNDAIKSFFQIDAYPSYYVMNNQGQVMHRDRGFSTPPGLWLRLN